MGGGDGDNSVLHEQRRCSRLKTMVSRSGGCFVLVLEAWVATSNTEPSRNGTNGKIGAAAFLFVSRERDSDRESRRATSDFPVRDKGSQEILGYLRRRLCSDSTSRLDLVMLIIDRRSSEDKKHEVCRPAGGQRVGGGRERGKTPGGEPQHGDPLRYGAEKAGKPRVRLGLTHQSSEGGAGG